MGLFGKKVQKEEKKKPVSKDFQRLPELPELPDFEEPQQNERLSKLPRFPNDSLGNKFSQDTIKEAITGEKEEGVFGANEFALEKRRMMHEPLEEDEDEEEFEEDIKKPLPGGFNQIARKVREAEPIFIRIDKFEESLRAFEKAKEQIRDIEKMLGDVKRLKEEEERELSLWEKEVQKTKQEIERIDQDIFSRVE